jgi:aryl-alcohol dehydrogenase-like predicted oxidoreductase
VTSLDDRGETTGPARLGLGCVNLGGMGRAGDRLVHHALDLGVRFFDTADAYGHGQSEVVLGRAVRVRRDEAVIATKGGYLFRERSPLAEAARRAARPGLRVARRLGNRGSFAQASGSNYLSKDFSPRYLRDALEGSLRRLRTDHVDLYQLHGPEAFHDDVLALMSDLMAHGKIRRFGIGLESLGPAEAWLSTGGITDMQIPFGVLDPHAGEQIIPFAHESGVSVIARGVLAGGFVGRSPGGETSKLRAGQPELLKELEALASANATTSTQLALWYVLARGDVSTALVGTSSPTHLTDAVRYSRTEPSRDVLDALRSIATRGLGEPSPLPAVAERGSHDGK